MRTVNGRHGRNGRALLVLVSAVALLALGVGSTVIEHGHKEQEQDRQLAAEAAEQAASIENYFERSRSLTQVMARNPSFRRFYELPGSRLDRGVAQGVVITEANEALAYLEELFPDSIGEACFIDLRGAENARAVKGEIAPLEDLSDDETGAPFFNPTFALPVGRVYQSRPYLSPDTNEWVIANSTPVATADGVVRAIVHFEVTIESFRRTAAAASDSFDVRVLDARTGTVVFDSRTPQRLGGALGLSGDRTFASVASGTERTGTQSVGGTRVAFHRIARAGDNANQWIVLTSPQKPLGSWLDGLGFSQLIMILGAFFLAAVAGASLRASHRELNFAAMNDALTALGNRRKLIADLDECLQSPSAANPFVVGLFDLDGFKAYNDTFGHLAGDSLLARLGQRLAAAVEGWGEAYRMGGDEFCVLASLEGGRDREELLALVSEALTERGEGFAISASYGAVLLPNEAGLASEALQLADQRMYSQKAAGRASASRQSADVLLRVLAERDPLLNTHGGGVSELAEAVARRLELSEEETRDLTRAASLHDVGKLAIPDAILSKNGPLDESEWAFMKRHTVIGERILGAAPSLAKVGKIVRATHERIDGAGYPDGLAGDEIPLAARVIAVCDAFEAITSERPYRSAASAEVAVAELRRCAGSQFDPRIVEVVCELAAELSSVRVRAQA